MSADILVFAAHPYDAELACSGTIASMVAKGKKVVVVDLTQGEMGTRGTPVPEIGVTGVYKKSGS